MWVEQKERLFAFRNNFCSFTSTPFQYTLNVLYVTRLQFRQKKITKDLNLSRQVSTLLSASYFEGFRVHVKIRTCFSFFKKTLSSYNLIMKLSKKFSEFLKNTRVFILHSFLKGLWWKCNNLVKLFPQFLKLQ